METIAAIATPLGSGGIGVLRISGAEAVEVAARVFQPDPSEMLSHTAKHGALVRPDTGERIDDVVLTLFRAPKSYTGEDVAEISCHGGISTVKAALRAVLDAGARLAAPGEFTQRAFLNGKMDLAQAEAVNDLIRARTDDARKVALRQLDGRLSAAVHQASQRILAMLAAIEAAVDFPEDVHEPEPTWLLGEICEAQEEVGALLQSFEHGRVYREGLRVVLAGRVNVGKSSLLNALLRHARAIVTPIPGTTRDVIEESLEIHGIPVVAIDTAGLRSTDDPVEKIGVELTRQSVESADIVLLVVDATQGVHDEDKALLDEVQGKPVLIVANKADLTADRAAGDQFVYTSATTGEGIPDLEARIARIATAGDALAESVLMSNARHREALSSALTSLGYALDTLASDKAIDLLSGDLAAARSSLGLVTGETASDDVLERIFSEFCIGK